MEKFKLTEQAIKKIEDNFNSVIYQHEAESGIIEAYENLYNLNLLVDEGDAVECLCYNRAIQTALWNYHNLIKACFAEQK